LLDLPEAGPLRRHQATVFCSAITC